MRDDHQVGQKITPLLMYTGPVAGKAKEAIALYTGIFPASKVDMLAAYEKGEGDQAGFLKHARFMLCGRGFMAMDSSMKHDFNFNEAISLLVRCDRQNGLRTIRSRPRTNRDRSKHEARRRRLERSPCQRIRLSIRQRAPMWAQEMDRIPSESGLCRGRQSEVPL